MKLGGLEDHCDVTQITAPFRPPSLDSILGSLEENDECLMNIAGEGGRSLK